MATITLNTPADRAEAPRRLLEPGACLNCGLARAGKYCAECGQRHVGKRLELRELFSEFVQQALSLDRGILVTIRDMTISPGPMIRRYTDGQRRRYVNPSTYLLLGAAVALLAFQSYGDAMAAYMRGQGEQMSAGPHPIFSPSQAEVYSQALLRISQQTSYTGLYMCVIFALSLRWLFRKSGINLAESAVFAAFTFGQVYLLNSLLHPLVFLATGGQVELLAHISFAAYVLICGHAAAGYFGRPLRSVIKTVLALVLTYAVFIMTAAATLMTYVLLFVPK